MAIELNDKYIRLGLFGRNKKIKKDEGRTAIRLDTYANEEARRFWDDPKNEEDPIEFDPDNPNDPNQLKNVENHQYMYVDGVLDTKDKVYEAIKKTESYIVVDVKKPIKENKDHTIEERHYYKNGKAV